MKPPKAAGRLIGYAQVSTEGQSTAAQVEQLRAAGCEVILREYASGGDRDCQELARALAAAWPVGDSGLDRSPCHRYVTTRVITLGPP